MARAAAPASGAPTMSLRRRAVGHFEQLHGPMGPPTLFTIPALRYMKTYGLTHEQLAMVSVVQRKCAAKKRRNQLGGSPKLGHYRVHFDSARGRKSRRNAGVDISSRVRSAHRHLLPVRSGHLTAGHPYQD